MAKKNFLVEGVSCTGKSSVCAELKRRGYDTVDGDKELAYEGDPETGERVEGRSHFNHIWDVGKVKRIVDDKENDVAFFCGGSRNFDKFIHLFDDVFVLDIDEDTLTKRLDDRTESEWGSKPEQRELIMQLHKTKEDIPSNATVIDATKPLEKVVDQIIAHIETES